MKARDILWPKKHWFWPKMAYVIGQNILPYSTDRTGLISVGTVAILACFGDSTEVWEAFSAGMKDTVMKGGK